MRIPSFPMETLKFSGLRALKGKIQFQNPY